MTTPKAFLDKLIKWQGYKKENPKGFCDIDNISCIVLDEVHERSLYCDLILGTLKAFTSRKLLNPKCKIIACSATMNHHKFK